jgi:DNA replication protein DnaC
MPTPGEFSPCERCSAPVAFHRSADGKYVMRGRFCDPCITLIEAEERQAEAVANASALAVASRRWRESSGIPGHLLDFRWKDLDADSELQAARDAGVRWARGEISGLILSGEVGRGKTRIAIAAANEMLESRRVHFLSAPILLARLGSGSFDSRIRQETLAILMGSDALVLDDLDKARPTEFAAEALFLAIDHRADGAGPLLVTTNLGSAAMLERWPEVYGEAIVSRLTLLEKVRIKGKDRRNG